MFQHPLYKPIFEFERRQTLGFYFYYVNWLVWEEGADTPAFWQFIAAENILYISNPTVKISKKWIFMPTTGLLKISDVSSTEAPEIWEIWQNPEPVFMQLRNPLNGKVLYCLNSSAVEDKALQQLRTQPLAEILDIQTQVIHIQTRHEALIWSKKRKIGHFIALLYCCVIALADKEEEAVTHALPFLYLVVPTFLAYWDISKNRSLHSFLPEAEKTKQLYQKKGFLKGFFWLLFFGFGYWLALKTLLLIFDNVL